MVCRKRNPERYYNTGPSTHVVPAASAPACIDDVDHSVTIVSKRQAKSSAHSLKGKYISPMTNASSSSLEPALGKGSDSLTKISKHTKCCSAQCCGGTGRSSPDSDIERGQKSYTYSINPECSHKGTSNPAGTIIISNSHDKRY